MNLQFNSNEEKKEVKNNFLNSIWIIQIYNYVIRILECLDIMLKINQ